MLSTRLCLAILTIGALTCLTGLSSAGTHSHEHGHESAKPPQLMLNNGKKWATDAPLRTGMTRIRSTLNAKLKSIRDGTLSNDETRSLSQAILKETGFIFQNCKLTPKADAVLHVILSQIIEGANALDAPVKKADSLRASDQIAKALNEYGQYFDHNGW